jgi:hypothetical protein
VFLGPDKGLIFVSKVVEWVSGGGVILDPNTHISYYAKKGVDITEVFARWPVTNFHCLGVIGDVAFVRTSVS